MNSLNHILEQEGSRNYRLTLTTWYEDDLSGESRHELYTTKKITVKIKIIEKVYNKKRLQIILS